MKNKLLLALTCLAIGGVSEASTDNSALVIINHYHESLTFQKENNGKNIATPASSDWKINSGQQKTITIKPNQDVTYISINGNEPGSGGLFGVMIDNQNVIIHGYFAGDRLAFSWQAPYANHITFCDDTYYKLHQTCD